VSRRTLTCVPQPSIEHQRRLPLRLRSRDSQVQLPQMRSRACRPSRISSVAAWWRRSSAVPASQYQPPGPSRACPSAVQLEPAQRLERRRRRGAAGGRRPQHGVDARSHGAHLVQRPTAGAQPDPLRPGAEIRMAGKVIAVGDVGVDRVDEVDGDVAADEANGWQSRCFHRNCAASSSPARWSREARSCPIPGSPA
jgi:hypothetical protein